jgi:hypothetical protein
MVIKRRCLRWVGFLGVDLNTNSFYIQQFKSDLIWYRTRIYNRKPFLCEIRLSFKTYASKKYDKVQKGLQQMFHFPQCRVSADRKKITTCVTVSQPLKHSTIHKIILFYNIANRYRSVHRNGKWEKWNRHSE